MMCRCPQRWLLPCSPWPAECQMSRCGGAPEAKKQHCGGAAPGPATCLAHAHSAHILPYAHSHKKVLQCGQDLHRLACRQVTCAVKHYRMSVLFARTRFRVRRLNHSATTLYARCKRKKPAPWSIVHNESSNAIAICGLTFCRRYSLSLWG